MNHTDLQSSTIESAYESILQCLRYGPSHSVNLPSDWTVIKQAFRKITPDLRWEKCRIFSPNELIIDFIEKEVRSFDQNVGSIHMDVLYIRNITVFDLSPTQVKPIIEQILQNHLDPFVQLLQRFNGRCARFTVDAKDHSCS